MYINFQTKSGHLTDPVKEGIDLFEHTLDKTALVWFQTNKSKFKDLTMLKTMFLQRYNPWGKTKREQLQSWNILSFNSKTMDVDEHIDLINTLGDMVDQKEEAKKETFYRNNAYNCHVVTSPNHPPWQENTAYWPRARNDVIIPPKSYKSTCTLIPRYTNHLDSGKNTSRLVFR